MKILESFRFVNHKNRKWERNLLYRLIRRLPPRFNLSGLNRFHPRWGRVNFWTRKGSKRRIIPKEKGVKKGETKKFARQRGREIKKGWINELGCASVEITRPEASVAPFPRTRQRRPLLSRYFLSLGQFLSKRRRSPFFLQFSPGIR